MRDGQGMLSAPRGRKWNRGNGWRRWAPLTLQWKAALSQGIWRPACPAFPFLGRVTAPRAALGGRAPVRGQRASGSGKEAPCMGRWQRRKLLVGLGKEAPYMARGGRGRAGGGQRGSEELPPPRATELARRSGSRDAGLRGICKPRTLRPAIAARTSPRDAGPGGMLQRARNRSSAARALRP